MTSLAIVHGTLAALRRMQQRDRGICLALGALGLFATCASATIEDE
jgi:hypothetical protein